MERIEKMKHPLQPVSASLCIVNYASCILNGFALLADEEYG